METAYVDTSMGSSGDALTTNKIPDRRFKGFGSFLVEAADFLTMKTLMKLSTVMQFKASFLEKLEEDECPGLYFLNELMSRGEISKCNISYLTDALVDESIEYRGIKNFITDSFHNNCCGSGESSEKNTSCDQCQTALSENKKRKCVEMGNSTFEHKEVNQCEVFIVKMAEQQESSECGIEKASFLGLSLKGDEKTPVVIYRIGTCSWEMELFRSYILRNYSEVPSKQELIITPSTEISETTPRGGLEVFSRNTFDKTTNVPQSVLCTLTPISSILNMKSEEIVLSVKGIIVKIAIQRVDFQQGTILTIQDARQPFLSVVVIEKIFSTLNHCEGDIIELVNFRTKRSKDGNAKSCYLLSTQKSFLRIVNDIQLQQVLNELPILGRYQVIGICTFIETVPYHACCQPQCREKKLVPNIGKNIMVCRRCGTEYAVGDHAIGKGCFFKLTIDDNVDEVSKSVRIIFNRVVTNILKEAKVKINTHREIPNKFKHLINDKKVRAIVTPGTPNEVITDLTLIRKPNRDSDESVVAPY